MSPKEQDILEQLGRIESSAMFGRSRRMRELLRFLVLRKLAAPDAVISAYVIGREVFRRGEDFDPNADPLVRVEAVRLRKLLGKFYAEGDEEPLLITIPKGQYTPAFHTQATLRQQPIQEYNAIGLMVLPVETPPENRDLALGISSEVRTQLSRVGELRIVNGSGLRERLDSEGYQRAQQDFGCDYVLEGQVLDTGSLSRVTMQLTHAGTRELVWSDQYELPREPGKWFEAINHISAQVVRKTATPAGALLPDQLFKRLNKAPSSWGAVDCTLRWHAYRIRFRSKPLYQRLQNVVIAVQASDPNWYMGHVIQSYLALDAWLYRMDLQVTREQALSDALSHASRALSGDPNNATAHYMLGLVAYFSNDMLRFTDHVQDALQRCPGNTDLMHHAGSLLTWGGLLSEGESMVLKADLEYQNAIAYRQHFVVRAYREREFVEMRALLDTTSYSEGWYLAPLLKSLCDVNLGDYDAARQHMAEALAMEPSLADDMELEIDKWIKDQALNAQMRRDLALAGFRPQNRAANEA